MTATSPSAAPMTPLPEYVEEAIRVYGNACYDYGDATAGGGGDALKARQALNAAVRRAIAEAPILAVRALAVEVSPAPEEAARGAGACARCGSDGACDADFHCAGCFREMEKRARHDPEHAEKERSLTAWRLSTPEIAALRAERDEWKNKAEAYHDSKNGYREQMLSHGKEIDRLRAEVARLTAEVIEGAGALTRERAALAALRGRAQEVIDARAAMMKLLASGHADPGEIDDAQDRTQEAVTTLRRALAFSEEK